MKKVVVCGGDGFCGWPTALHLSSLGAEVTIVDNLSRRRIGDALGAQSLTPIASIEDRVTCWNGLSATPINFVNIDIAADYEALEAFLAARCPDAIIHFAEQRAAPYSMRSSAEKRYTIDNNTNATHNLLVAVAALELGTHFVHLGSMGVYGYGYGNGAAGMRTPEGYLTATFQADDGGAIEQDILYPTRPGSIYHLSKSLDQLLFQFYVQNDALRITDLHQGVVWGTQTQETSRHETLINRFDYDGDYGTVLNRFLMQAAAGYPMTVNGTGGQTRAFINIQDTVRCVALALQNPPTRGDRVRIINQMTETYRVRDLANLIAKLTGAEIAMVDNPRKEAEENDLSASNDTLLGLGLKPVLLKEGLMAETMDICRKYLDRFDEHVVPCLSTWTSEQKPGVVRD